MTKVQVYIDFEAISAPFSFDLKVQDDLPYAYTLGLYVGKKFKISTKIINFNEISIDNIFEHIRLDIISKIRKMLDNKTFGVNKDSVEFIGWAPNLEKQILNKALTGCKVKNMLKGQSLSLSALTKKAFSIENYFPSFRKAVNKDLDEKFIQRRGLDQDGSLAALAGYQLLMHSKNKKGKYSVDINTSTLVKEIIQYSKDDVKRMQ